jgi:hypothetical protein
MYLNGTSFNGIRLQGVRFNDLSYIGTSGPSAAGALRVEAVRLADGRAFSAGPR